jgi:hypothetical protein
MRCLGCGGEMQLTNVAQADAMMIPGFEHHTMTCPACGDVERRLVFGRREQRAEPPVETPIEPPIEVPIEPSIESPIESLLALPAESTPLSPADSAGQAEPLEVRKPWTQAIERLQLRHTAMARETTGRADADAEPAQPAKPTVEPDDFDRLWDSLAGPASPPPLSTPLAVALDHSEPPAVGRLEGAPQSGDCDARSQALTEAVQPQIYELGEASPSRKLPAPLPAASSVHSGLPAASSVRSGSRGSKGPGVLRGAWARAAAMLRPRQVAASKPNGGDAILQVDAGDLRL